MRHMALFILVDRLLILSVIKLSSRGLMLVGVDFEFFVWGISLMGS